MVGEAVQFIRCTPMSDPASTDLRLTSLEQVMHIVVDLLRIHGAKLDAILDRVTREDGPSDTVLVLKEIAAAQAQTNELLQDLPANVAAMLRDGAPDDDDVPMQPAETATFDE